MIFYIILKLQGLSALFLWFSKVQLSVCEILCFPVSKIQHVYILMYTKEDVLIILSPLRVSYIQVLARKVLSICLCTNLSTLETYVVAALNFRVVYSHKEIASSHHYKIICLVKICKERTIRVRGAINIIHSTYSALLVIISVSLVVFTALQITLFTLFFSQ